MFVLVSVLVIYAGVKYFYDSPPLDASECTGEFRQELPDCASQERTGSHLNIVNNCDFEVTLRWDYLGGEEYIEQVEPGAGIQLSSFPLKIHSLSCCSKYTWCY